MIAPFHLAYSSLVTDVRQFWLTTDQQADEDHHNSVLTCRVALDSALDSCFVSHLAGSVVYYF